jgi:pimeloyl-ACP methyl ester carboxylesterase
MPIAQLSKVRLEYFEQGHGPERVVLIHGFQASARIWQLTQLALPADRFTSVAINNRGAGASEAPASEHDYSVPIFAADAFELVTKLGWDRFTLVGHSLGGATVAQFAVDHPAMVTGLILLDPADPDGRQFPPGSPSMETMLDRMIEGRRAQQARGGGGDGIDASGTGANAEFTRLLAADMRAAPEQRLRGSMRSMFEVRLGERVKTLPMPVVLVGGDKDELIPVTNMLATWAKYPAGTGLHFWHGVGHSPNVDCPEELAALIARFAEGTVPSQAPKVSV